MTCNLLVDSGIEHGKKTESIMKDDYGLFSRCPESCVVYAGVAMVATGTDASAAATKVNNGKTISESSRYAGISYSQNINVYLL